MMFPTKVVENKTDNVRLT